MNKTSNNVIKKYNVIGDDFYYHHTFTESSGEESYHAPEAHTQHEVLYLVKGEVSYIIEGETYDVKEGDMIFVAPNEIHTLKINGKLDYERIVLLFDISILEGIMRSLDTTLDTFRFSGKNRFHVIGKRDVREGGLDKMLLSITEGDEGDKYKKLDIMSKLISFVIAIDKTAARLKDNFTRPTSSDKLVTAVTAYIDSHIGEEIRLDALADSLFVSKSTLCHRFSSYMNMTPGRYVTVKKMHRALELLRGGLPSAQVAREVGYDNYTSFFYNYKKVMGTSPLASRIEASAQMPEGDGEI